MTVAPSKFADLGTRTLSALILAVVAFAALYAGGLWTAVLLAVGAALMVWEVREMVVGQGRGLDPLGMFLSGTAALAVIVTELTLMRYGVGVLAAGALIAFAVARRDGLQMIAGYAYVGVAMVCLDALRTDTKYGLVAVVWLIVIVIAADVGGYFGGRLIGGPKLWPRISPKKTWAGLGGGLVLAALVGLVFSGLTPGTFAFEVVTVSILTALVSVGGDLGESSVKRHYGVKDSSRLLPGHGGLLDRFDGLMAAGIVATLITFARGQSVFIWT
ncbi:MAG: phosphatidate cytidylyltransferase [Pseudomonadota bacterium]